MGWLGNEAAKVGLLDRNDAWGNAVDKLLTSILRKAREVICWLAKGVRLDGRLLGKIKKQVHVAGGDQVAKVVKGQT